MLALWRMLLAPMPDRNAVSFSRAILVTGPSWLAGRRGMSQRGKEGRRRARLTHLVKVVSTLKGGVTT